MQTYRAYPMNLEGHFIGAIVFEACDDDEAFHVVYLFSQDSDFEIWCGQRLVGRVDRCGDRRAPERGIVRN